jgi:glycerophosphoryl diester phosphodiesterase
VSHPFFALTTPIVIGHRGAAGEAPENTLASFERALADGAAVLESDLHLTRDGVPVLIHDDELERCTDGAGRVRDQDLAALRRLDAGYRFQLEERSDHPFRGRGLRIPTLGEALDAFPRARFNLELKERLPGMVEQSVAAVARRARAGDVLLTSANDLLMAELRAHVAAARVEVALGASTGEVARFAVAALRGETPPRGPMALQIPPDFAGQPLVTRELVAHAHRHGVHVHVWTIDEPAEMRALLDLGVDGIVTNFPARLSRLLASRAARVGPQAGSAPG